MNLYQTMSEEMTNETIAALATAPGEAGIAVVRISGPDAFAIADRLYNGAPPLPSARPPGTFAYGRLQPRPNGAARDDQPLDEVIMLFYRAPHSYTREDVVEIQGHGGRICAGRMLRTVLTAGARAADPGEFTRRAFLNGRIDLVQAEAVADLIQARSDRAATAAMEQLAGALSHSIEMIYDEILSVAADLEAMLDFHEEDLPQSALPELLRQMQTTGKCLENLLDTWEEGHLLRDGALVVIAGQPNAGKSTLLNRLLGHERAIVTSTPGTTRDTIEEQLVLEGVPLRLVDTAGIRRSDCHIEQEGIARTHASLSRADLVIYIIDASQPVEPQADAALTYLSSQPGFVVLNKTDISQPATPQCLTDISIFQTALSSGRGVDQVRSAILQHLDCHTQHPPHAVISERHRQVIHIVLNELNTAVIILNDDDELGMVPAASHLRESLEELGRLIGRTYDDSLLDKIFSRFCVGK